MLLTKFPADSVSRPFNRTSHSIENSEEPKIDL